ncbi:hypothetical protein BGX38DRAFT_1258659 [Terfezia claveryi]|nr:hypothetical protein BGX38DRAFT_1264125 [Terfezia claveryi]KAF8454402.1 hypothetical protein BGX38DRAFT_1258659 [Terfezia claveryi]
MDAQSSQALSNGCPSSKDNSMGANTTSGAQTNNKRPLSETQHSPNSVSPAHSELADVQSPSSFVEPKVDGKHQHQDRELRGSRDAPTTLSDECHHKHFHSAYFSVVVVATCRCLRCNFKAIEPNKADHPSKLSHSTATRTTTTQTVRTL